MNQSDDESGYSNIKERGEGNRKVEETHKLGKCRTNLAFISLIFIHKETNNGAVCVSRNYASTVDAVEGYAMLCIYAFIYIYIYIYIKLFFK